MKKTRSRRYRALRWLLLLAISAAALQLCNVINFTSAAALRDVERELGLEETEILAAVDYWETPNIHNEDKLCLDRYMLSTDGDALMFSVATCGNRTIGWEEKILNRGIWQHGGTNAVDILWETYHSAPRIEGYFILCGRVSDREVTELELQVTYGDWGVWDESYGTKIESETFTVDEFVEWNGERVFLKLFETPESHRIAKVLLVSPEQQVILDN